MFLCGNGALGCDGDIYAANETSQVLKVGTTRRNNYTLIGDPIYSGGQLRGDHIVGDDQCIYWPPSSANHLLKFDPEAQQLPSLVGDERLPLGGVNMDREAFNTWRRVGL